MNKTPSNISQMRKNELIELADGLGLNTEGTRADILERVKIHYSTEGEGGDENMTSPQRRARRTAVSRDKFGSSSNGSGGKFKDPKSPFVSSSTSSPTADKTAKLSNLLDNISPTRAPTARKLVNELEETSQCLLSCPFKLSRGICHLVPSKDHYQQWPVSRKLGYLLWIVEFFIIVCNSLEFRHLYFGPYPFLFFDAFIPSFHISVPLMPSLKSLSPYNLTTSPLAVWFFVLSFIPFVFGHCVRPEVSNAIRFPWGCMPKLNSFSFGMARLAIIYLSEVCPKIVSLWSILPYRLVILTSLTSIMYAIYEAILGRQ